MEEVCAPTSTVGVRTLLTEHEVKASAPAPIAAARTRVRARLRIDPKIVAAPLRNTSGIPVIRAKQWPGATHLVQSPRA